MLPGAAPVGAAPFLWRRRGGMMLTHPTGPADVDNTAELELGFGGWPRGYPYTVGLLVVYVFTLGPPPSTFSHWPPRSDCLFWLTHGAVDTLVAHKLKLTKNPFRLAGFLVAYLGLAAVAVAFWLVAPTAALLTFLLISAWHFGGDWSPTIVGFDRFIVGVATAVHHHALPPGRCGDHLRFSR